jgi:hypothetical protein
MLDDNEIVSTAYLLTIDILKAKGLTQSDYMYYEVESTLFEAEKNNRHMIAVAWPDNTYCFFSSSEPITLEDLFPAQLKTAYQNKVSDHQLIYSLG